MANWNIVCYFILLLPLVFSGQIPEPKISLGNENDLWELQSAVDVTKVEIPSTNIEEISDISVESQVVPLDNSKALSVDGIVDVKYVNEEELPGISIESEVVPLDNSKALSVDGIGDAKYVNEIDPLWLQVEEYYADFSNNLPNSNEESISYFGPDNAALEKDTSNDFENLSNNNPNEVVINPFDFKALDFNFMPVENIQNEVRHDGIDDSFYVKPLVPQNDDGTFAYYSLPETRNQNPDNIVLQFGAEDSFYVGSIQLDDSSRFSGVQNPFDDSSEFFRENNIVADKKIFPEENSNNEFRIIYITNQNSDFGGHYMDEDKKNEETMKTRRGAFVNKYRASFLIFGWLFLLTGILLSCFLYMVGRFAAKGKISQLENNYTSGEQPYVALKNEAIDV